MKQFPKARGGVDGTAQVEIQMGRMLFPKGRDGKTTYALDPIDFPGIRNIS